MNLVLMYGNSVTHNKLIELLMCDKRYLQLDVSSIKVSGKWCITKTEHSYND